MVAEKENVTGGEMEPSENSAVADSVSQEVSTIEARKL